jgi:hypothetical protein
LADFPAGEPGKPAYRDLEPPSEAPEGPAVEPELIPCTAEELRAKGYLIVGKDLAKAPNRWEGSGYGPTKPFPLKRNPALPAPPPLPPRSKNHQAAINLAANRHNGARGFLVRPCYAGTSRLRLGGGTDGRSGGD